MSKFSSTSFLSSLIARVHGVNRFPLVAETHVFAHEQVFLVKFLVKAYFLVCMG